MKRDSYSNQQAHASFQPRSPQSANDSTQLSQPVHHSSSSNDLGSKWLNKASRWVADKFQTAQNLMGSGDKIASDQILPALRGTATPSQSAQSDQPLVGVIDSGFGAGEHGSKMVEAIQQENPQSKIWRGGGVGTGGWSESLVKFVDTAKAGGHSRAVANLSFDLTEVHPDGSTSNRSQLTANEQSALAYARDNNVLIVASAGNQGGAMSALGQASQPFDNLIVVGAANGSDRASYSSYGKGLDLVADVGAAGTSLAAAKTTGAIAKLWSDNPELSSQQVNQMLTATATDLKAPGWDAETGAGLLNSTGAIDLAKTITPKTLMFSGSQLMQQGNKSSEDSTWRSTNGAVASERTAGIAPIALVKPDVDAIREAVDPEPKPPNLLAEARARAEANPAPNLLAEARARAEANPAPNLLDLAADAVTIQQGETLWDIAQAKLGSGDRWRELRKADGTPFTEQEASQLQVGTSVQIPGAQPEPIAPAFPDTPPTSSPAPSGDLLAPGELPAGMSEKDGVNIDGLVPELRSVLPEIVQAYADSETGFSPLISSGNDGEHGDGSAHYENQAIDLSSHDSDYSDYMSADQVKAIAEQIADAPLRSTPVSGDSGRMQADWDQNKDGTRDFVVLVESPGIQGQQHIHIQLDDSHSLSVPAEASSSSSLEAFGDGNLTPPSSSSGDLVDGVTPDPLHPEISGEMTVNNSLSPNMRAFLDTLSYAEGTYGPEGYRVRFGGETFDGFGDHPRIHEPFGDTTSTAAGRYQFIQGTWDGVKSELGLADFRPENQDLAAVEKIEQRGALEDVEAGRFDEAIGKLSNEWAALPGSPYGQPTKGLEDLRQFYETSLQQYQGEDPAASPPTVSPEATLVSTDSLSESADPVAASSDYLQLGQNDSKAVREWQEFLNTQGINIAVDGDFGEATHEATINFQNAHNLEGDGIVGPETRDAAAAVENSIPLTGDFSSSNYLQQGQGSPEEVKAWQQFLNEQGTNIAVDGIFGSDTHEATINFQNSQGLPADGIVGPETQAAASAASNDTPSGGTAGADAGLVELNGESKPVTLRRYSEDGSAQPIDPNQETVVVVHGWKGSGGDQSIQEIARQASRQGTQVLTLDWGSIAQAGLDPLLPPPHNTAKWIAPVGQWAHAQLQRMRIDPNKLTLVGHSLGTYVSAELAAKFGKVKNLVALDPAFPANNNLAAIDVAVDAASPGLVSHKWLQGYDVDGRTAEQDLPRAFRDVAENSLSFVAKNSPLKQAELGGIPIGGPFGLPTFVDQGLGGVSGDNDQAATAHNSFVVEFPAGDAGDAHSLVVSTFIDALEKGHLTVPDLTLPNHQDDWYSDNGNLQNGFNSWLPDWTKTALDINHHEGRIAADASGEIQELVRVVDDSGTEEATWA